MDKLVDYGAMQNLYAVYSNAFHTWMGAISDAINKESTIENSTNISGNRADHLKEYLKTVYSFSSKALCEMMELYQENFLLYIDSYYQNVDQQAGTVIDSRELENIRNHLQDKRKQIQSIGLAAEVSVRKIKDIVDVPNLDVSALDEEYGSIITSIDNLDTSVNELENIHLSRDFTCLDDLVNSFDSFIKEVVNLSEDYKTDFSAQSFWTLASVPALYGAINAAQNQLTGQQSAVEQAMKNLEKRLEAEQRELEKRQEQAEWAKISINAVVGFLTAAALVTAGPVGAIVVGTVSGMVSSAFSSAADEYVQHGFNFQEWNSNQITIDACIGGVTGMIGGLAAPGMGTCVKAGIKATSSAVKEFATSTIDQLTTTGQITDIKGIADDALLKGFGSFVGNVVGSTVSDGMEGLIKKSDTIKDYAENVVGGAKHFGAVLAVEASSEIPSGYIKRVTSTTVTEAGEFYSSVINGESVSEAYDEYKSGIKNTATDYKSIVGDAIGATSNAALDNPLYASEKKLEDRADDYYKFGDSPDLNGKADSWDKLNKKEYKLVHDKLKEMDTRGDDAQKYEIFGNSPDLNGKESAWKDWNSTEYDRMTESLRKMDEREENK